MKNTPSDMQYAVISSDLGLKRLEKVVDNFEDKIRFLDRLPFEIKSWVIRLRPALISYSLTKHERPEAGKEAFALAGA